MQYTWKVRVTEEILQPPDVLIVSAKEVYKVQNSIREQPSGLPDGGPLVGVHPSLQLCIALSGPGFLHRGCVTLVLHLGIAEVKLRGVGDAAVEHSGKLLNALGTFRWKRR
jgi:hypothetical protein